MEVTQTPLLEESGSVLKKTWLGDHAEDSNELGVFKVSVPTNAPCIPRIYPHLPPSKQTNKKGQIPVQSHEEVLS